MSSRKHMSLRQCIPFGIFTAFIASLLFVPICIDVWTGDYKWGMEKVPLWVKLLATAFWGFPIYASLVIIPLVVYGYVNTTNKIEDKFTDFLK